MVLKGLGINSALSRKQLSWKLAILFTTTCPKRVSSFTSPNLSHHTVLPEGVAFTLTVPKKGTRPDETVQAFFACYPSETNLCLVNCLNMFLTGQNINVNHNRGNQIVCLSHMLHCIIRSQKQLFAFALYH